MYIRPRASSRLRHTPTRSSPRRRASTPGSGPRATSPTRTVSSTLPPRRRTCWVQAWVDEGYPAIACHQRPEEHPLNADSELAKKYPLASVQRKTRSQVHTTFKNLETMLCMDGRKPNIYINTEDAADRGIAEGDEVTAFNDRGEHTGLARVTDHLKKGVVVLENGWEDTTASSSSNVTSNKWPTLGTIHCCNSTLVEREEGGVNYDSGILCQLRRLLRLQELPGGLRHRRGADSRRVRSSRAPDLTLRRLVAMPSCPWLAITATNRLAWRTAPWAPIRRWTTVWWCRTTIRASVARPASRPAPSTRLPTTRRPPRPTSATGAPFARLAERCRSA